MWGNYSHSLCKNKRHRKAVMSAKCQSSWPSPPPFRPAYCHGQKVSYFSHHCKAPIFVYSTRCPLKKLRCAGRQKNYSLCGKMHYQQIKKSSFQAHRDSLHLMQCAGTAGHQPVCLGMRRFANALLTGQS